MTNPEDWPIVQTEKGFQMLHRVTGESYWNMDVRLGREIDLRMQEQEKAKKKENETRQI